MCRATFSPQRALQMLVVLVSVLCVQRPAAAAPFDCLTGGPSVTLEMLIALGNEGCVSGDRQLFDFAYSIVGSGGADLVSAEDVWVFGTAHRNVTYLQFGSQWTVGTGQALQVEISYSYRIPDVLTVGVLLEPFWIPEASLTATACLDDTFPCAAGTLVPLPTLPVVPGSLPHLPHSSSFGAIRNVVGLDGSALDALDSITASSVTNKIIPEPPMWSLFAAGLVLHRTFTLVRGWTHRSKPGASHPGAS